MTGCMLMADDFCLVIAEGSQKSHKKYGRLMLNRINWNQSQEEEQQGQYQRAVLSLKCTPTALSHQNSCVVTVRLVYIDTWTVKVRCWCVVKYCLHPLRCQVSDPRTHVSSRSPSMHSRIHAIDT